MVFDGVGLCIPLMGLGLQEISSCDLGLGSGYMHMLERGSAIETMLQLRSKLKVFNSIYLSLHTAWLV